MVDVKVESTFGKMLSDTANVQDANRHQPAFDGTVRDVRHGALWRNHPLSNAAMLGGFIGWMFLLYMDEAELCCPIGAFRGKHKYMFGYWVCLNLSFGQRWKLQNIQLAFICQADLFTLYGACAVISGTYQRSNEDHFTLIFVLLQVSKIQTAAGKTLPHLWPAWRDLQMVLSSLRSTPLQSSMVHCLLHLVMGKHLQKWLKQRRPLAEPQSASAGLVIVHLHSEPKCTQCLIQVAHS